MRSKMKQDKGPIEPQAALEKIKNTEEEARQIIQKAREEESVKIIQRAQAEAVKMKKNHLTRAREKARKKKDTIVQQANKEAQEIRNKTQEEASDLRDRSEALMPEAVQKTADKVKEYLKDLEI